MIGIAAGSSGAVASGQDYDAGKGLFDFAFSALLGGTFQSVGNRIGPPRSDVSLSDDELANVAKQSRTLDSRARDAARAEGQAAAEEVPFGLDLLTSRRGRQVVVETEDLLSRIKAHSLDEAGTRIWVDIVNNHPSHKSAGYSSIRLYQAMLREFPNAQEVHGAMMFDNASAIRTGGLSAAPRTKVLQRLGFTSHSYDESTGVAVAKKP